MPKFRVLGNVMYTAEVIVEAEDADEAYGKAKAGDIIGEIEQGEMIEGFEPDENNDPEPA